MLIKILEGATDDVEKRVNEWMDGLHAGAVRNICVISYSSILVWYEGRHYGERD